MNPPTTTKPLLTISTATTTTTKTTTHHNTTFSYPTTSVRDLKERTHLCITICGGRGLSPACRDPRQLLIFVAISLLILGWLWC